MATVSSFDSDQKGRPVSAAEIVTCDGTRIYLLPVETFPGHLNNLYLIDHPDHPTLVDAGTASPSAQHELESRFDEIRSRFGVETTIASLAELVITHAHIDHFGGAHEFRRRGVPITIHELDARVLEGFHERFLLVARDFMLFLRQTGLSEKEVEALMVLYRGTKGLFRDLEPDRRLYSGDRIGPGWEILHVPGHCPGMICLLVDDVVLTADHLLARITPVQRPQAITPFTGLENYLRSLEKLLSFGQPTVGLGGHDAPIADIEARVRETVVHHGRRLLQIHELCRDQPRTVAEISLSLFGPQKRYGIMLALSEAGAHVEHLHDLGYLVIDNLDEVSRRFDVPPRYCSISRDLHPVLRRTSLPIGLADIATEAMENES